MFLKAATPVIQLRQMATLKEISLRLKSVQSIAKITKSMKMIASTKVNKAQRGMEAARVYGNSGIALLEHTDVKVEPKEPLLITCSSDRGLCGGIHSSVSKATKRNIAAAGGKGHIAVLGQKARTQLTRDHRQYIDLSFDGITKYGATWYETALVGDAILAAKLPHDGVSIIYNQFKSVIAYEASAIALPTFSTLNAAPKLAAYEIEEPVLDNFAEFMFGNAIYWAVAEGYCSEMCAKRSAMENATKNAGEMIQKLTLRYNRGRQASITNDLIDIITGAMAV
ncbi:ATPase, F1 complex, gamma subunit domain-containing protein [Gorgonomyces haynaldii]|nr:ATPase, F1 complex, gamma subunit domain-containing protein [Gorgonomyces haynaldii]